MNFKKSRHLSGGRTSPVGHYHMMTSSGVVDVSLLVPVLGQLV
jgi:hypothetical protein